MQRLISRMLFCLAVLLALTAGLFAIVFDSRAQENATVIKDCSSDAELRNAIKNARDIGWQYPIRFYCGEATIHLTAPLSITRQIDLDGSGVITLTGDGNTHHFDVGGSIYVKIAGITLVDGYALNSTDAITPVAASIVNYGALELYDVTISNSRAEGPLSAGAIANFGNLQGDRIRFLNLEGESAGVLYDIGGTSIFNSEFLGNRGGESGAIVALGSTGVGNSTFRNNVGVNGSGVMTLMVDPDPPEGVYPRSWGLIGGSSLLENQGGRCAAVTSRNGDLRITYSTVASNTTTAGGVVCIEGERSESTNIEYSTISGNHSSEATVTLVGYRWAWFYNVTIANNQVDSDTGAVLEAERNVFLSGRNNIISAVGVQGCLMRNPGNQGFASSVVSDASCASPYPYQDFERLPLTMVADPLLGPLADNGGATLTHLPLSESPARGLGRYCAEFDQRLVTRWPGTCDAGSVEIDQRPIQARLPVVLHQNYPLPTPTFTPQP